MIKKLLILFYIFELSLLIPQVYGKTIAPSNIKGDIVWSKKESPYLIENNITIEKDASLKIEPGVKVVIPFKKNNLTKFIVHGSLTAIGSENELISFTSSEHKPGSWGGITFDYPSKDNSIIEYCLIENARCAIACFKTSPKIQYNTLSGNEVAIVCEDYASPAIISNKIINNGIAEIYTSAINCSIWSSPLIKGNMIEKNYGHAIYCDAYSSPIITENKISNLLGADIVCASFSNPEISKNDLTQGTSEFGLIFYHSSPKVMENKISGKRIYGLTSIYSSPVISNNIFSKNYIGILCIRSSPEILGNEIFQNNTGMVLAENSRPKLDKNNIHSNSIDSRAIRDKSDFIPTSQNILFRSFSGGSWNIGLIDGNTSAITMLTKNDFHNGCAEWSPDGSYIAFTSNRGGNWDIYIMDKAGNNVRNITNSPIYTEEAPPMWSHDSKYLCYERETPECQTVILDLDTKKVKKIDLKKIEKEYPGLYPLVFIWIP